MTHKDFKFIIGIDFILLFYCIPQSAKRMQSCVTKGEKKSFKVRKPSFETQLSGLSKLFNLSEFTSVKHLLSLNKVLFGRLKCKQYVNCTYFVKCSSYINISCYVILISSLDISLTKIESFQCWHPSSHNTCISDMFSNHLLNTLMHEYQALV